MDANWGFAGLTGPEEQATTHPGELWGGLGALGLLLAGVLPLGAAVPAAERGFRRLSPAMQQTRQRGPRIAIPEALQKEIGGGFGKLRRGAQRVKSAKALQGRNPVGSADIPSWDAVASTEAPSGRDIFGALLP